MLKFMNKKKKKVDDWQHCCRYCKYYNDNHCLILFGDDEYNFEVNPLLIEEPDKFYCAYWE